MATLADIQDVLKGWREVDKYVWVCLIVQRSLQNKAINCMNLDDLMRDLWIRFIGTDIPAYKCAFIHHYVENKLRLATGVEADTDELKIEVYRLRRKFVAWILKQKAEYT